MKVSMFTKGEMHADQAEFRLFVLISNFQRDPLPKSQTSLTGTECARQRHSLTRMPTAGKAVKETAHRYLWQRKKERPQIPVSKKERTNHKCWWQTKNGCPNQASILLTPNERNKTTETTSKTQTVAYLQD